MGLGRGEGRCYKGNLSSSVRIAHHARRRGQSSHVALDGRVVAERDVVRGFVVWQPDQKP